MKIDFDREDARVAISGEFTFSDHTEFVELVRRLLLAPGNPIKIDLSQLDFIDSAGLGMLLIAREEVGKASRALVLRAPRGQVRRMFTVTKFDSLFTIEA